MRKANVSMALAMYDDVKTIESDRCFGSLLTWIASHICLRDG
jgi:hypothetical protein